MARAFPKNKVTAHQVTSDDLEIDSGTLSIDATNNRIGMGTTSPGAQLEVQDTTTSSANTGGSLRLSANDGSPMGDSHRLGVIEFTGAEDSSNTQVVGARIEAMTDAAWTNVENGTALYFYTTDGNASQTNVLKIDSNKKATFAGNVTTDGSVSLKEKAAAIADTAAYGQLWVKTATPNELYYTTDAGDDIQITSGTTLAATGDITGVTAGDGLSGGGTSGGVSLALDLKSNGGLEIQSGEVSVAQGISQYDVAQFAASVADNDFLRIDGTAVEGLSAAEVAAAIEGSIDAVGTIASGTWQGTAIARAYIANDAINGDKIADDAVDSEHYVDGSIDTAHIADNQVTLDKMAGLARGSLIIGNASGDPSALAAGSANYVLTSDGTDIAWASASGASPNDLNTVLHNRVFF